MSNSASTSSAAGSVTPTSDDPSPSRRRGRLRRGLLGVCLVPIAGGPALAEGIAQGRLAQSLERCQAPGVAAPTEHTRCVGLRGVDFDLHGVHLYGIEARWDAGGGQASAEQIDLGLRDGEWQLTATGVHAQIDPDAILDAPSPGPAASGRAAPEHPPSPGPPSSGGTDLRTWVETELRRWPVNVDVAGTVDLRVRSHVVRVQDPSVHSDPDGTLAGRFDVGLHRDDEVLALGRDLRLHNSPNRRHSVQLEGVLALADGDEVGVRGAVDPEALSLQFATRAGGQGWVKIPSWRHPSRAELRFETLDLGPLDPLRGLLGERLRVDLQHTRLSGELAVERRRDASDSVNVEFYDLAVDGLVVESAHLSRDPLYLRPLTLDGHVALRGHGAISGKLGVRHGEVAAQLRGRVDDRGVDLAARLEPMECQAFLASMPAGLVPMLEGTRLDGSLDASFALAFDWGTLEARAAEELRTGEPQPAPGVLEVDFPFLEACRVERDAPGVSVDALSGPYRHRFLSDSGRELTRVFDPVDPHWVRLEEVGVLARAFVTLEDVGFWRHDGFDREQMARAFWHDLSASRFSRGASTITQQTARNLWLGIDRSVGRKLQEAVYASRLEAELSKGRILEVYLNIIELGPEVHGVHEAASFHFGRAPHELNLLEAVHLASLAPGPVMYSERFASGEVDEAWAEHLREQLRRMRIHGLISHEQERAAARSELRLLDRSVEHAGEHASGG